MSFLKNARTLGDNFPKLRSGSALEYLPRSDSPHLHTIRSYPHRHLPATNSAKVVASQTAIQLCIEFVGGRLGGVVGNFFIAKLSINFFEIFKFKEWLSPLVIRG